MLKSTNQIRSSHRVPSDETLPQIRSGLVRDHEGRGDSSGTRQEGRGCHAREVDRSLHFCATPRVRRPPLSTSPTTKCLVDAGESSKPAFRAAASALPRFPSAALQTGNFPGLMEHRAPRTKDSSLEGRTRKGRTNFSLSMTLCCFVLVSCSPKRRIEPSVRDYADTNMLHLGVSAPTRLRPKDRPLTGTQTSA